MIKVIFLLAEDNQNRNRKKMIEIGMVQWELLTEQICSPEVQVVELASDKLKDQ